MLSIPNQKYLEWRSETFAAVARDELLLLADAINLLVVHPRLGQLTLAAKLNVANGGGNACINNVISKADTFLTKPPTTTVTFGSNSAPSINYTGPTGTYSLTTAQRNLAVSLKDALDRFNNNLGCP